MKKSLSTTTFNMILIQGGNRSLWLNKFTRKPAYTRQRVSKRANKQANNQNHICTKSSILSQMTKHFLFFFFFALLFFSLSSFKSHFKQSNLTTKQTPKIARKWIRSLLQNRYKKDIKFLNHFIEFYEKYDWMQSKLWLLCSPLSLYSLHACGRTQVISSLLVLFHFHWLTSSWYEHWS